jgi:hypothetical protein
VDEHVLAAVIADDEAEALLRIEEFDDTFAFADDLRRHAATATAETAAATAPAAEPTACATAAIAAGALAEAASTAAAIAAASAARAGIAATFLESASVSKTCFFEKPVALIPAATATIAFAPSIETHSV